MLIAFIAIIALANYVFAFPQTHLRHRAIRPRLQNVFGWVNAPFAWLMGVPAQDCLAVGQILGERIVLNEFVGYLDLTSQRQTTRARPAQFHDCHLRAVRLCEFFQHRHPGRRHRLARAGTPQRNGQSRFPRDDRRLARRLHDRLARGIFALTTPAPFSSLAASKRLGAPKCNEGGSEDGPVASKPATAGEDGSSSSSCSSSTKF